MMMKYELKKFFNKKINKMILVVMVFLAVVISYLAVGSMRYRDAEGKLYTGVTAGRRLAADRNKWKGKLTEEKIKEVVEDRRTLEQMYPEGIPDREYGKTVQSYDDIFSFGIYVFTPDSGYDQSVLYHWSDQQSESFYSMYETNILKMVQTYGKKLKTTGVPEKEVRRNRNAARLCCKGFLGYHGYVCSDIWDDTGGCNWFSGLRHICR